MNIRFASLLNLSLSVVQHCWFHRLFRLLQDLGGLL
jgi:hypothetical protein